MEASGQLHAPAALPPRKEHVVPIAWGEVSRPQSRSGHSGGEEKNSQPLPELEPPIIQIVAQTYTTELFQKCKKIITCVILHVLQ
jgi:hypothetical protein